ncbi:hypothetical protein FN846DRAFT_902330 [Sphaerosporella brunnea]|uniref:Uncharacterized protein n=1 Tax=Sphaerosporella brunnea TaxID=1250544 RepID=A0A5J5FAE2_9PEZI|nr:hypothetical protein FN846DRAFT_902330 [Sphaerosporella brunnea]
MRSDPALQAALDAYSVAVQRYKTLSDLLPPAVRPPALERFAHRQNRWAVERRTGDVRKLIARMERQLEGVRPQVAPTLPTTVPSTVQHDGLVEATVGAAAAVQIQSNSGQPGHAAVAAHSNDSRGPDEMDPKGQEAQASRDDSAASVESSVVTLGKTGGFSDRTASFAENSLHDLALGRPDSGSAEHMPRDGSDLLSPASDTAEEGLTAAEEIEAVIRVGVVSPDAAIEMSRAVDKLKADGARAASVKKVYSTFLRCIEEGASFPEVGTGAERNDD